MIDHEPAEYCEEHQSEIFYNRLDHCLCLLLESKLDRSSNAAEKNVILISGYSSSRLETSLPDRNLLSPVAESWLASFLKAGLSRPYGVSDRSLLSCLLRCRPVSVTIACLSVCSTWLFSLYPFSFIELPTITILDRSSTICQGFFRETSTRLQVPRFCGYCTLFSLMISTEQGDCFSTASAMEPCMKRRQSR